jgi:hypothetical protein
MLNGAPVSRNLLIGVAISSLIAVQFGTKVKSILGFVSAFVISNPNEAIGTAGLIYQAQNIERIIGSEKLFARLFHTTLITSLVNLIIISSAIF